MTPHCLPRTRRSVCGGNCAQIVTLCTHALQIIVVKHCPQHNKAVLSQLAAQCGDVHVLVPGLDGGRRLIGRGKN